MIIGNLNESSGIHGADADAAHENLRERETTLVVLWLSKKMIKISSIIYITFLMRLDYIIYNTSRVYLQWYNNNNM